MLTTQLRHVSSALMAASLAAACSSNPCEPACSGERACVNGYCLQPCGNDAECTSTGICTQGYCVLGNRGPAGDVAEHDGSSSFGDSLGDSRQGADPTLTPGDSAANGDTALAPGDWTPAGDLGLPFSCPADATCTCPGTGTCFATIGANSDLDCGAARSCSVGCEMPGGCSLTCREGTSSCNLRCMGATDPCSVTCDPGVLICHCSGNCSQSQM